MPVQTIRQANWLSASLARKRRWQPRLVIPASRRIELIDDAYERKAAEDGSTVHIFNVPVFLPNGNELMRMDDEKERTKYKKLARNAVLAAFGRHVPHMCVDRTFGAGVAERERKRIKFAMLARVSPEASDDDNNITALKYVRDAVCAWIVCGPVFDVQGIGDYDEIVWSAANPTGYLELMYSQLIVPGRRHQPATKDRPARKRQNGRFGLQIELHQR